MFEPSQVLGASLARWMRERGGTATQAADFLLEVLQAWVLSRWDTHTGTAARWSRTFTPPGRTTQSLRIPAKPNQLHTGAQNRGRPRSGTGRTPIAQGRADLDGGDAAHALEVELRTAGAPSRKKFRSPGAVILFSWLLLLIFFTSLHARISPF